MAGVNAAERQLADVAPDGPYPPVEPFNPSTDGVHTGAEDAGAAHGAKPGLPQLDTTTFASQLFWLFISFALLYAVMSWLALPRLQRVLKDRETRIRHDLDEAAKAKRLSEEAIAAYEHALAEARAKARKTGDDARAQMQTLIDKRANAEGQRLAGDVARAEARIQAMRVQALSQVHAIAAEAAATIVEHLGGSASAPQIQEAVAAHLKRSAAA